MSDDVARKALAQRWSSQLGEWAIPEEILAQAPESPWAFDPNAFRPLREASLNQTQVALMNLLNRSPYRSVLDVGAGAGAAVLPIGSSIRSLLALDQNAMMLEVLALESEATPEMLVETRVGDFFSLEPELGRFDVVTSQNVIYNIPDLFGFLEGLLAHAEVGVVLEMTLHHPHYGLNLLWEEFHQLQRPTNPTATDVIEALEMLGVTPKVAIGPGLRRSFDPAQQIISTRRRLCLGSSEDRAIQLAIQAGHLLSNPTLTLICEVADE
ncbi:class I SAM-dependent methyltransferase [Ferrimicrobium sp.]|uniref:class I SAM-dependent methyltransferase n=1 Tax=Ferrimicrobium sp. TaxID=2926050 RepID=UPI0026142C27|nr:class I SAM-dependent methyltransferase [Ferrimicrobium sp.]